MSDIKDFQLLLKRFGFGNVGYTEDGIADIAEKEFAVVQGKDTIEIQLGEGSDVTDMGYSFVFDKDGKFKTHKSVE